LLKLQNQLATEESDLRSQAWAAGLNLNTSSISNPSQVSFQKSQTFISGSTPIEPLE
jgi:hypothetical protein